MKKQWLKRFDVYHRNLLNLRLAWHKDFSQLYDALGVSQQVLSTYLARQSRPNLDFALAMSRLTGLSIDALLSNVYPTALMSQLIRQAEANRAQGGAAPADTRSVPERRLAIYQNICRLCPPDMTLTQLSYSCGSHAFIHRLRSPDIHRMPPLFHLVCVADALSVPVDELL